MHLAHVHIEGFRNFTAFDVSLHKGLNVIVGENNIGKTNLLDAIRVALGSASGGSDIPRVAKDDLHRDANGMPTTDHVRIRLEFRGLTLDEQAEHLEMLNLNPVDPSTSTASLHFEWTWNETSQRYSVRRWGSDHHRDPSAIPETLLQGIPTTYLGALRDALAALTPGRFSRLGRLLASDATPEQREALTLVMAEANEGVKDNPLVAQAETRVRELLQAAVGPDLAQKPAIRASDADFDRIVAGLKFVLTHTSEDATEFLSEIRSNGLGYNNLLYIATVLAELDAAKQAALPLLLVEEPEAHLHPQLQTVLADFLSRGGTTAPHAKNVQIIVTSHSPTIAAHVEPKHLLVLHRDQEGCLACPAILSFGLSNSESRALRRMLDVTRASMLFAKGVIFVEGVTEAILMKGLSSRLTPEVRLDHTATSVVPVAGVEFETLAKLYGPNRIQVPVSIVTDGDPAVEIRDADGAEMEFPGSDACARATGLVTKYSGHDSIRVFVSSVTLEYDLALAGDRNAELLVRAWHSCYQRPPRTLSEESLQAMPDNPARAQAIWRTLCRADPTQGKFDLAHQLLELLLDDEGNPSAAPFVVPPYLENAMRHASRSPKPDPIT